MLPRNLIKVSVSMQSGEQRDCVQGIVDRLVFTGTIFNLHLRVGDRLDVRAALTIDEVAALGEDSLRPKSVVTLKWRPDDIVFVADTDPPA